MSTNKSSPQDSQNPPQRAKDSHKTLIKSTSILSAGTLTSRIFGFLRDIVLARLLGTGFRADAFFVAFKIPNLFRDLIGEGATNSAVVPVFSEYLEQKKREEFWHFASVMFSLALIVLSIVTILGIFLAPVLVRVIAPGFMAEPQKLELTIRLTKLMFPYLVLIGLTAYSMGILYTFRSFVVPAFTPCLLNISLIVSALLASRYMEEPVFGLAIGVLIGGILQLSLQIRPLTKVGMKFKWPSTLRHSGAKKIGTLLLPRMLGTGVYQMTVLIDTFCASLATIVGVGGISAIYFSNRILNFPMGIFSVAMASAALPTFSGLAAKKELSALKDTLVFSLKNIFFIMCPTTAILLLLSNPIIRILFQRGEFDVYSTHITSMALSFYAIGLFGFGGIKILVAAFHALQDTKTPVKVAAFCLAINAALNFILMFPLKVGGIALASAISGTIDFLILLWIMNKRLGGFNSGLLTFFIKVTIASVITAVVEYYSWNYFQFSFEVVKLIVIGGGGFVFYWIVCLIMRIEQAHKILRWMLRKS